MSNVDLRLGDCLSQLAALKAEGVKVRTCVTSPPYWGLRAYGTNPQIWQNGHELCAAHEWQTEYNAPKTGGEVKLKGAGVNMTEKRFMPAIAHDTCSRCGAWRGELGLEPTPEMYTAHLVEVFRAVRDVLADDGTLWLNLGDNYASNWGMGANRKSSWWSNKSEELEGKGWGTIETAIPPNSFKSGRADGLKVKDLVGIPWRVAFALQADGWYLRSDIIWHKPNPMPESVTDRPTKSHEYIFLLSKQPRYYYDADAIKEQASMTSGFARQRLNGEPHRRKMRSGFENDQSSSNIDLYSDSGTRNRRSVWTVTTKPFKGEHFATFPPDLIEPCILAGSAVGDIVLDPFNGAGTTGLVALKHGRSYIGIELNPDYLEMTRERLNKAQLTLPLGY